MCRAADEGGRRCTRHTPTPAQREARRIYERAQYARKKAARGEGDVDSRRKAEPSIVIPKTVRVDDSGWVVALSTNPKSAEQRNIAAEQIGAEFRTSDGRVIWSKVTDPKLKALRSAVEGPAPRGATIPAGLVDATGKIDRARYARLRPELQTQIRKLVHANFR
ncbi:hypothetical protein [Microbacterium sp. A84]|uniref:hypothetical protein n=1 Tax=Microbacterium sp. A84 TaxID=3450715 RepID=UPI003F42D3F7